MANIKLKVLGGLYNDYNIFNLNEATAPDNILIDIITDGEQFVENSEAEYAHAGSSAYREFEGVLPLTNNDAIWDEYGVKFAKRVINYFRDKITAYLEGELWDIGMYPKYTNQFSVDFEDGEELNVLSGSVSPYDEYEYVSHSGKTCPFNIRKIQTRSLRTLSTTGMSVNASIIHFSKYYNIHSVTSGELKVLRPLIYYEDDLNAYNMTIDGTGTPYVKSYLGLAFWRELHSTRHECVYNIITEYNGSGYKINNQNYRTLSTYYKRSENGDDWSQFDTNPGNRYTFTDYDTSNWNTYVPEGFHIFGWWRNVWYFICKGNVSSTATRSFPAPYSSVYDWSGDQGHNNVFNGEINGYGNTNTAFVGIMYRNDSAGNFHMFNTYFPVETSGDNGNQIITQKIKYKLSALGRYPEYIGTIIASILANIYVYKDGDFESTSVKYVSDIIYLTPNSTTYTKDVVFRTHVKQIDDLDNPIDLNTLLLFHKKPFNDYITVLKRFVDPSTDDKDGKFNDNNVTLNLKEGIKNVPLQFRMDYLEPNLALTGEYSSVKLHNILGEETDIVSDIIKPNLLYQVDDSGQVYILNENFTIKWLDKLEVVGDKLHAKDSKWADLPAMNNSYIKLTFNFKSGMLDFKTTEVNTTNSSKYYAIYSRSGSYGNTYYDLVVDEILVPSARVV